VELLETDPFTEYVVPTSAKRVVSFLRGSAKARVAIPMEADGARILGAIGREVFTAYVPGGKGPVFMKLIDKAFGADVTTRTWETVRKCAAA
jgi:uncharacterized protein (DUF1697 family)